MPRSATASDRSRAGALVLLLALVALVGARAIDPARNAAPPPSPPRIDPPGALFADGFDHGLDAWTFDRVGVWSVRSGVLRADLPDGRQEHSLLYAGDSTWTDIAVDLDVCGMRGVDKGVIVRVDGERGLGVDLRGPGYQDVKLHVNELPIGRADAPNANGVWHHLRIAIRGKQCRVWVDGERVLDRKVSLRLPPRGRIALAAYTGGAGQCTVYYDNVVVTPLQK